MFRAGHKTLEVLQNNAYAPRAVYRAVAELKGGKGIEMSHSLRRDEIRTKRLDGGLKRSLASNPSQSMIQLAKTRNVTKMTISKAVKKDIVMISYFRGHRNTVTMLQRIKMDQKRKD